jgi:hypothetical protein
MRHIVRITIAGLILSVWIFSSLPALALENQPNGASRILLPMIVYRSGKACKVSPTLVSPLGGISINTLTPIFHWQSVTSPLEGYYTVEFATDTLITQNLGAGNSVGGISGDRTLLSPDNLLEGKTYYWRAFDQCGGIKGPYSSVGSFITPSGGGILPATPVLSKPDNGAIGLNNPVSLQWSSVQGATNYLVIVSSLASGESFFYTIQTSYPFTGTVGTNYSWTVRAENSYGYSPKPDLWSFTIGTP